MFKKIILTLILIVSFAFAGTYPVNSIEYSASLKLDKFSNGQSDVKAYQQHLFDLISTSRIVDDSIKLDKEQKVSYWDTKEKLLRGQKIIVRLRTKGKQSQITLKYRGANKEAAENFDLPTDYKTKTKTEIDRYINKDSFSRSITVKIKETTITSAMLLEIFPSLKNYGLTAEKEINAVNNYTINSKSYEIGEYRFGKKKAKKKTTTSSFDLALWSCDNGKIIAAEVSWKIRNSGIKKISSLNRAMDLLKTISLDKQWTAEQSNTKTSITYDGKDICKQ